MKRNNILILSAGRRVKLVEFFQSAAKRHLKGVRVLATDMFPEFSPACHVADEAVKAPRVTDPDYIQFLKNICAEHAIGLLIPTIDTELLLLSDVRQEFAELGSQIIISSSELIGMCRDKRLTANLFDRLSIDQPAIYNREDIQFPCFCKPYDGSCSQGALPVFSEEMLTPDLLDDPKNMFMELVGKEFSEYTVDAYYDREGALRCLVPRERLEVRAGEVSKGITRRNAVYDYLRNRLNRLEGAVGCITAQFFFNPDTGIVKGLEINPRFGGGYPLSLAAGADYPDWLVREYLLGEMIEFFDKWKTDLMMLRYDEQVIVDASNY